MAMDINGFKQALKGGARPNQFKVGLTFPDQTGDINNILVTGASLPASTVNPAIIQYRGREVKLAGERIFDPWTITIVNDAEMSLRQSFEAWMEMINSKELNTAEGALLPETYQLPITVTHLDRNEKALPGGHYTLVDAFPINMSEIALQYAQNDVIEEYTVTFQYQHYFVPDQR